MKIQMKNNSVRFGEVLLAVLLVTFLTSCNDNTVYNQYQSIKDNQWHRDSIINFKINSTDTISKNNLYVTLRNNKDYEFSNLFLIVGIKFPNNYQVVDTLEYEMTSPEGRFLGTGITDLKENKLEYKTNVTFSLIGEYNVSVQQAMRKTRDIEGLTTLNGITDVGLQIEKLN
jgi:gliding motility-associated lipoprotein GldH